MDTNSDLPFGLFNNILFMFVDIILSPLMISLSIRFFPHNLQVMEGNKLNHVLL